MKGDIMTDQNNDMDRETHPSPRKWRMVFLLLDPRGAIGRREYVAGVCVLLFVTVGMMLTTAIPAARVWFIHSFLGGDYLREYVVQAVLSQYLPGFLPFSFLIFAGSAALSMKRARGAGLSLAIGIAAAVLSFLFLSTLRVSFVLFALVTSQRSEFEASGLPVAHLAGVTATLLVLGLLQVVIFATIGGKWRETEDCPGLRRMDTVRYPLFLGKFFAIVLAGTVVLALLCFALPHSLMMGALSFVLGIGILLVIVIWIVGMCMRLREGGYRFWVLPSTILGLVVLVVVSGLLLFFMDELAGMSIAGWSLWKIGMIDYALQFGLYLALSLCFVPFFVPERSGQVPEPLANTPSDQREGRPRWLTVIAILMIIGAVIGFASIFMLTEENSILMGLKIPLPAAAVVALIANGLSLYCGIGFLRLNETARRIYIPLAIYGIVNAVLSRPALIKSVGTDSTMRSTMWWMLILDLLISVAILVYVIRIRDRFRNTTAL